MKSYRVIILIPLLLVECVSVNTPLPNATATMAVTSVAPEVQVSALPTSDAPLSDNCFSSATEIPNSEWGHGVVVLKNQEIGLDKRVLPGFFLLNMETREITSLEKPNEGLAHAFVSPDGTMISAELLTFETKENNFKTLNDELLIMSADGTIIKKLNWEDGAVGGAVWLDNQHLVMNVSGLDTEENQGLKPSTLLVLNPFTDERQILKADLPEIYAGSPLPFWDEPWGYSLSVYNKPLTRVVYLGEGGYTYVLWDLQQKKEILRLLHWNNANHEQPRWSPDGSKFIISAYFGDMNLWPQPADGLYLIDSDGNISKLITTDNNIFIRDHFWSPSGRYVALFLHVDKANWPKRLQVFDTETLQIIDTCVEFESPDEQDAPIWSPDESQILLYDFSDEERTNVILVDLMERLAFPIAENMEPRGWMLSP